jgi:hypothetical protein
MSNSHQIPTDLSKRIYEDLRWGRVEVFTNRNDLVEKYQETGGVVGICQRKIVADACNIETIEQQLRDQGCDISHVAIVHIPSIDFS